MTPRDLALETTRSPMRAVGAPPTRRRRRLGLRWAALLAVGAAAGALSHAVATRAFDREGPWRTVYVLHDEVWLPAVAWTTTAFFPLSVVWILPAVALLASAAVEALTPLGPLRRMQAATVRFLAGSAAGRVLLTATPGGAAFAGAVVADLRAAAVDAVVNALDRGRRCDAAAAGACRLTGLAAALGPARPEDALAAIEVAALTRLAGADPARAVRAARDALAGESVTAGDADAVDLHDLLDRIAAPDARPDRRNEARRALTLAARLRALTPDDAAERPLLPVALAAGVIRIGLERPCEGPETALATLEAWSLARAGDARETLAAAEAGCRFDHWARRCEAAAARPPHEGMLAEGLGDPRRDLDPAEGFAWSGIEA